jgi:hypothetical protein
LAFFVFVEPLAVRRVEAFPARTVVDWNLVASDASSRKRERTGEKNAVVFFFFFFFFFVRERTIFF